MAMTSNVCFTLTARGENTHNHSSYTRCNLNPEKYETEILVHMPYFYLLPDSYKMTRHNLQKFTAKISSPKSQDRQKTSE